MEMASTQCLGSTVNIDGKPKSPFKAMDAEIYLFRDIECTEKEKVRAVQHDLKVHEKSTFSSRARCRKALKKLEEAIERETKQEIERETSALDWTLAFAKCIQSDKQSITDYISEQKELFLLEYAVKTKQRTISKLEEMVSEEERRAKLAETKLEEDAVAFDEFLKENDRRSVEALKIATQEAKAKMEVTMEVKSAMNELFSLKSEIVNSEDELRLSLSYEAFLLSVSPKEWQDQQMIKKKLLKKDKRDISKSLMSFPSREKSKMVSTSLILRQKINKWSHVKGQQYPKKTLPSQSTSIVFSETDAKKDHQKSQGGDYRFFKRASRVSLGKRFSMEGRKKSVASCSSEKSIASSDASSDFSLEDLDSDEEPEIYFKDPDELLQLYRHLEEQNLSLFQNIQDLSGTLEDARQREHAIVQEILFYREKGINEIVNQKKALIAARIKEEQKSAELELKIKVFSSGDYNPTSMDKTLNTLKKKITEVYRACCGTIEVASMTSFQMLKAIEIRVSELCEMLEILPPEYLETVEVMEKLRAKQRRQRVREDKLKELKRIQEERLKHALERAIAVPKTRVGRKLVFRSQPPEAKQKGVQVEDLTTKSEDDYFFS
nr:coiled-coil domain-containing protein 38 isoform X1 [Zootoca vivipara]XP_034982757.1 coiled-coil domain-containing protein 38 isoform X1 [Zootoca vivipara]XP_034982758.1 coiled-coil domain-containing protein 38 isoform X1 [Zootoca vivipara]XP_034982759.1 coiled-coil domain-containing protein 38 isoform X1 [Zootoca vivipara]XP_034982760.1 coiled-coil domain-containing protein 38 isoform X1 [Zootoca vivipara]XP_034982762.1 coiled-coil domain-containing protein 38 isoform X1 [Zootoca vivipara]